MADNVPNSVQGRTRLQIRGRARGGERTLNIWRMFVTLDVSKLRGWLNDVGSALFNRPCRVEMRAYDSVRGGAGREAGELLGCGAGARAQRT